MIIVKKILALIAVMSLLVVGGAIAGSSDNLRVSNWGPFGRGMTHMANLSESSLEEITELKGTFCQSGTSMIDALKDEGLYETWKSNILETFEEQIANQIEQGQLSPEEAQQILNSLAERIDEGPPFGFGHIMGRGNRMRRATN